MATNTINNVYGGTGVQPHDLEGDGFPLLNAADSVYCLCGSIAKLGGVV